MISITFCSVLSALSNEMLFKKIRCEMVENEVIKNMSYFHKKQKTPVFLKMYLGQKSFFLKVWLSWFLNKGYPMDILKFKFGIVPCYGSTAEFSMTSWILS